MIELQILPQGITKQGELFPRNMRQGAAGFLEPHPFGDLGRCDSVGSYGTVNMSIKVTKLPQMSFWNANCSGFLLLLRDVPISFFSFDTTHGSRCHIYWKLDYTWNSQSFVLRPELRQIVCPTTVVREESSVCLPSKNTSHLVDLDAHLF